MSTPTFFNDQIARLNQIKQMGTSATDYDTQIQQQKNANAEQAAYEKQQKQQAAQQAAWQKQQAKILAAAQNKYAGQNKDLQKQIAKMLGSQANKYAGDLNQLSNVKSNGTSAGLIQTAANLKGIPYKWGGNTVQSGLDCSGYVKLVFSKYGINLPRTSAAMAAAIPHVSEKNARPGDLVFFSKTGSNGTVHHVGIYAGHGKMWNEPHTGASARLQAIWGGEKVIYGRAPANTQQKKKMALNAYSLSLLRKMGSGRGSG